MIYAPETLAPSLGWALPSPKNILKFSACVPNVLVLNSELLTLKQLKSNMHYLKEPWLYILMFMRYDCIR